MAAFRRVVVALLLLGLLGGVLTLVLTVFYARENAPLPLVDQCVARVTGDSVALDTDQAHYASIISGVATRRGLVPRAASIALATVYQESGIRNLDHGDRDSLGLFQQRPSQGWGTPAQVRDPWYASDKFYEALVKVPDWRTGNINDVAQAVQRSGYPQGYARHVENARRLGSSLTGETPASWTCRVASPAAPDPAGMTTLLRRTLPESSQVTREADVVTIRARTPQLAWSAAHIAVANTAGHGVQRVEVGTSSWTASRSELAPWQGAIDDSTTVVVRFDSPSPSPTPSR